MEFEGLPIIVSSFTPYKMPCDKKLFFLTVKPEQTLLKRKVNPQYFVVIDMEAAKAFDLVPRQVQEPWIFKAVFFFTQTRFIGQRNISPTIYEFCEYEIIMPKNANETWQLVRNDHLLCLNAKGITAVCFDDKKQALYFIREQAFDPKDEFEVY